MAPPSKSAFSKTPREEPTEDTPPKENSKSRSFRPRGKKQGQTPRPVPTSIAAPLPAPIPPVVPKPQHLSKTSSPLQNDPLWLEAFSIEGDKGFTEEAGVKKFAVSTDGFTSLVRRTYHVTCAADKEFSRNVSPAMYEYYNTQHFWARTAAIREHRGMANEDERRIVRYLQSSEYIVHEPINIYLRGIGDFDDPSGTQHRFELLRLPGNQRHEGVPGFFGRVSANTHYLYESLPSPGVAAKRLQQDYAFTLNPALNPVWDLPDAVRPEEQAINQPQAAEAENALVPPAQQQLDVDPAAQNADDVPEVEQEAVVHGQPLPTANLLGWMPSQRLTSEQRQAYESCGINGQDDFPSDIDRFALSFALFEHIAARVRVSSEKMKSGASLHEHANGSLAQCPVIQVYPEPIPFNRTRIYSDGNIRSASAFQLDVRLAVASRITGYRIEKATHADRNPWCCYDYDQYRHVPPGWIATMNAVYTHGNVARLNACDKFTAYTERDKLRTPFVTMSVVKKSNF